MLPSKYGSAPFADKTSLSPRREAFLTFECWWAKFWVSDSTIVFMYDPTYLSNFTASWAQKEAHLIFISGLESEPAFPNIVHIYPIFGKNCLSSASRHTSRSSINWTLTSSDGSVKGVFIILEAIAGSIICDSSKNPNYSTILEMISMEISLFFST